MKSRITLALAAAVLLGGPAFAQPHGLSDFVKEFDTNKDGTVTHEEYRAIRDARFTAGDTDKNGALSEAEYVAEYASRLDANLLKSTATVNLKAEERETQLRQAVVRFGVLDTNKDASISLEEFLATGEKSYKAKDTDKDGKVTMKEPKSATEG